MLLLYKLSNVLFCGLGYLLVVQRSALVFVYCFVDDEGFAFFCLIIFLSSSLYPLFLSENGFIYKAGFDLQTLPTTCRSRSRPGCKERTSRLLTDMVPTCSTCYRAVATTRCPDGLMQGNREESWGPRGRYEAGY